MIIERVKFMVHQAVFGERLGRGGHQAATLLGGPAIEEVFTVLIRQDAVFLERLSFVPGTCRQEIIRGKTLGPVLPGLEGRPPVVSCAFIGVG